MKVTRVETLHADAGHKDYSFCKISTDDAGIVGWSEYSGNQGVDTLIESLGAQIVGRDPCAVDAISQRLRRQMQGNSFGGTAFMAIAALENALIDIKAKAVGLPVCELLGGPIHRTLPVYWTQCGNCRLDRGWNIGGGPNSGRTPVRSYEDVTALGREAVAEHGFNSIKTMIFVWGEERGSTLLEPMGGNNPTGTVTQALIDHIVKTQRAWREGVGPDTLLKLDLNFNFKPEGFIRICKALEPLNMDWIELDVHDPQSLRQIRDASPMPIASLESLFGRKQFKPYLDAGAVDIAIIDAIWNGVWESMKIASLCDTYDVNCAAHNFCGHLGTAISAHFLASIPNLRVLEYQHEQPAWAAELFTSVPTLVDGELDVAALCRRPGWGIEVNEEVLRAHPSQRPHGCLVMTAAPPAVAEGGGGGARL